MNIIKETNASQPLTIQITICLFSCLSGLSSTVLVPGAGCVWLSFPSKVENLLKSTLL